MSMRATDGGGNQRGDKGDDSQKQHLWACGKLCWLRVRENKHIANSETADPAETIEKCGAGGMLSGDVKKRAHTSSEIGLMFSNVLVPP